MIAFFLRLKFWWSLRTYGMRVVRLFMDRRVSPALKAVTALGALVAISPIDLLSDVPILGLVDDAGLLALIAALFVFFCPRDVVAEHFGSARQLKNVSPGPGKNR